MKRIFIAVVLVLLVSAFAFATENFTVKSFTGTVTVAGRAVQVNETLSGNAVITISLGASIVLADANGTEVTLRRTGNGTGAVAELFVAASGVRLNGNVATTDTSAIARTTTQTGTASARASDQAGEDDIANE